MGIFFVKLLYIKYFGAYCFEEKIVEIFDFLYAWRLLIILDLKPMTLLGIQIIYCLNVQEPLKVSKYVTKISVRGYLVIY